MALPKSFNDPFDCNLSTEDNSYNVIFDQKKIKLAAKCMYENYGSSGCVSQLFDTGIIREINGWIDGTHHGGNGGPHFLQLINERVSKFGIQCFSKVFENYLMWAHYADSHKGFCIEYDYDPIKLESENNNFSMYPVIYTSTLPRFSLTEILFSPHEVSEKLYATKPDSWAYEKEHRLIYFGCINDGTGTRVGLPSGLRVKSVIAGLSAEEKTKENLKSAADSIGCDFEVVNRGANEYSLDRVKA